MAQAVLSGLLIGGLYALLSLGFLLKLRIADTVNLAYGGFVVLGMYASLVCVNDLGLNQYAAVPVAALVVGVFAWVTYKLLLESARRSGHREQIIYTLILLSVLELVFQFRFGSSLQSLSVPATGVQLLGATVNQAQVVAGVVALAIGLALFVVFKRTQFGKTIEVAGTYEAGARSIGIPVERVYAGVFVFGSVLAGLAGGLVMTFQPVSPFLGLEYVLIALLVTISARLSFAGCVVMGLAYGLLEAIMTRQVGPELAQILVFVGFLVILAGEELLRWGRKLLTRGHLAWAGRQPA